MTETTLQNNKNTELHAAQTQEASHHEGPHIPLIQGETVWGPISNITLTLIVFLMLTVMLALWANRSLKKGTGKVRLFFLSFIQFFDGYIRDTFDGDKKSARKFFPLIVGMFFIIFFGNLLGLVIDWFGMSISPTLLSYLRPMHSDLNTTLVLAVVTIVMYLTIQVRSHGGVSAARSYLFNFRGKNIMEKGINVFVGWLHFIGLYATTASLSLRLFGNIFAGIILVGIITYLGAFASSAVFEVGRLLAIPFWFFEVFVSLIQALVFVGIMMALFKQAAEDH